MNHKTENEGRVLQQPARSRHLEPLDGVDVEDGAVPALDHIIAGQDGNRLHACLACIEPDQQRAIRAAFFDGYTYDELARREELPLSTIKSRIRRGLMKLRACMDET